MNVSPAFFSHSSTARGKSQDGVCQRAVFAGCFHIFLRKNHFIFALLLTCGKKCAIINLSSMDLEVTIMEHIKTIETRNLCESAKNGGCGECQTSCQSACKTSCGIANQQCESAKESK
jgi:predicted ribosomally synthesized six-cysteine peptide SCIFF